MLLRTDWAKPEDLYQVAVDVKAVLLSDGLNQFGQAAALQVGYDAAARAHEVMMVACALADDVAVATASGVDPLEDTHADEEAQCPEDGGPADARGTSFNGGAQGSRRESVGLIRHGLDHCSAGGGRSVAQSLQAPQGIANVEGGVVDGSSPSVKK